MTRSAKRPFSVTILLWLVLSLTVWSSLRLVAAIRWWDVLLDYMSGPGPFYLLASALFWSFLSLFLLWGLWQRKTWARFGVLAVGAGFAVWYWSDRLLFQLQRPNWPFSIGATIVLLVIVIVCVFIPSTQRYFAKERGS